MASLFNLHAVPQCMSCIRRVAASPGSAWLAPARQQVRGKKKLAKPTSIKVRLLKDLPRFGRQGTIIPITAGRMRNQFYPRRLAEYVTKAQLQELGLQHVTVQRDSTFGTAALRQVKQEEPEEQEVPAAVTLDLLKPERAMTILSKLLPASMDFYRPAIATPPAQNLSPSIPASSRLSETALRSIGPQGPQKVSIYGSVTTADIAVNLKAMLAQDSEGARVVLSPEDISFVEEGEEHDRVKHLGTFGIDILLKGASVAIRRTITVNAQD